MGGGSGTVGRTPGRGVGRILGRGVGNLRAARDFLFSGDDFGESLEEGFGRAFGGGFLKVWKVSGRAFGGGFCVRTYGTYVRYGTVRYGTVRYGTVRYGTVRYGTVRYGTVRYGTVRYGKVR